METHSSTQIQLTATYEINVHLIGKIVAFFDGVAKLVQYFVVTSHIGGQDATYYALAYGSK